MKKKVLFVCIHNSARSQMAEAFLRELGLDDYEVESAGLEPGNLNQLAVEAMKELSIDISGNKTKSVFDIWDKGKQYDYVVTVCDEAQSERCPVFPGSSKKLHWGFADPSSFGGSWGLRMQRTREVRDAIRDKIKGFIDENR